MTPAETALSHGSMDELRLRRLIAIGRRLVAELDLEVLLMDVVEAARDLTGARYAALGVLNERGDALDRFLTVGLDEETRTRIGDLPRGNGVLGVLISDPRPLRLADVSEHPRSYGFPAGHPPMRTFLGVPLRIRDQVYGNLYMTDKESGEFDEADQEAAVVLAEWAGIAIENARLYENATRRSEELARAVAGFEASLAVARAVGGETELDRILELIAKRGRALVEADSMLIALYDARTLTIRAVAGRLDRELEGQVVPLMGTAVAEVINRQRSLHIHDDGSPTPVMAGIVARAGLVVPLVFRTSCVGVICALDPLDGSARFTADHQRVLEAFASSGATAVATGQNVAQERLRRSIEASEGERRRWARELHDETLQDMASLKLLLGSARRSNDVEAIHRVLDDVIEQLTAGIRSLRHLIGELRPAVLDDAGLQPALEALGARIRGAGIDVSMSLDLPTRASGELPREVEDTLYRLVQEALTNVVKHADATEVSVAVSREDGRLEVNVEDNGSGIDQELPSSGYGLMGMRERAALVGGTIEIASEPGRGTRVSASIPVPEPGDQP
ncbi:MAG TPA: GAF domain-containing sensor histidine kinase [Gaiellales bacterium]|nr:GAF domain-containing sensor histidine kinase [Gaiellales bacterium]